MLVSIVLGKIKLEKNNRPITFLAGQDTDQLLSVVIENRSTVSPLIIDKGTAYLFITPITTYPTQLMAMHDQDEGEQHPPGKGKTGPTADLESDFEEEDEVIGDPNLNSASAVGTEKKKIELASKPLAQVAPDLQEQEAQVVEVQEVTVKEADDLAVEEQEVEEQEVEEQEVEEQEVEVEEGEVVSADRAKEGLQASPGIVGAQAVPLDLSKGEGKKPAASSALKSPEPETSTGGTQSVPSVDTSARPKEADSAIAAPQGTLEGELEGSTPRQQSQPQEHPGKRELEEGEVEADPPKGVKRQRDTNE